MSCSGFDPIEVKLPGRAYKVHVGSGILQEIQTRVGGLISSKASKAFVIVDTGVPESFVDQLIDGVRAMGMSPSVSRITPSESVKTVETVHSLLIEMAQSGHTRVDPVFSLGGGVVGDIAGFVAASYQRGVPIIQCPTTLLSMVDASVGGKTGVNLQVPGSGDRDHLYKNLVGAFHQPIAVFGDISVLDSLDMRYRRSGLAECVKHGMICQTIGDGHEGVMDWMIEHRESISRFETRTVEELVVRNVGLKASVVVRDEKESIEGKTGGRMLLNFGHTFGHAIETIEGLSPDPDNLDLAPLHHGEAVGLGMIAACRCAESMGNCDSGIGDELIELLEWVGLPTKIDGLISGNELVDSMGHDKKAAGGSIRLILPIARGKCEIHDSGESRYINDGFDLIRF